VLKTELAELLRNGENSGVEFKRDDILPERLAREVSGLANLLGGRILLGVEDDGTVSGLARGRQRAEEWSMQVVRDHIQPPLIPYWEVIEWEPGVLIGIVSIPEAAPDKPYKAKLGNHFQTFVRVGTLTREATREEEGRLYQAAGILRYDIKPVPGSRVSDLDQGRLDDYFGRVLGRAMPGSNEQRETILVNTDIAIVDREFKPPTVGGMVLFGTSPNRFLKQAGISATSYPGVDKSYAANDLEEIQGPLVSLFDPAGRIVERGTIDRAMAFVERNMGRSSRLVEGVRRDTPDYPIEAVRETIVNAVVHRDYTIALVNIELGMYSDRLEVVSPGRLPNTVTIAKMKEGYRASRNELLKDILRDYGYVESRGMGVRTKIIAGMIAHTGREPELIEREDAFAVRLLR